MSENIDIYNERKNYSHVFTEFFKDKDKFYLLGCTRLFTITEDKIKCFDLKSNAEIFKAKCNFYYQNPFAFLSGDEKILLIFDKNRDSEKSFVFNNEKKEFVGNYFKWVAMDKFYLFSSKNNGVEVYRIKTMNINSYKKKMKRNWVGY